MNHTVKQLILTIPLVACTGLASLSLSGCGGDNSSAKNTKENIDYSKLSAGELKPEPLREASSRELEQLIKNGLRLNLAQQKEFNDAVRDTPVLTNAADEGSSSRESFSGTNVQVQGVDEADHVKYDGKYIFLAAPMDYINNQFEQHIKIIATDTSTAQTMDVGDISLTTDHWGEVSELYLVDSNASTSGLVTLRRSWNFIAFDTAVDPNLDDDAITPDQEIALNTSRADERFMPYHMHNGVELTLYDVRTPSSPNKTWTMSLDGDLLSSRKIGNTLYLITSFMPGIEDLTFHTDTIEARIANENLIKNTRIEKLLPEYSINGGSPQPLTSGDGCLIPESTTDNIGYTNFINITAINLSSQEVIESVCVNGYIEGIYSSQNNLYLGASKYEAWNFWQGYTVVHQFSLTETGVDYRATGSVEGILGWNNPSFRMDEHDNNLRMITTVFNDQGERTHHLTILRNTDNTNVLTPIASLPNDLHPEPIGKPNEDIYAVRFHDDRAYIVTFQRVDPLYVVDLSDATDPFIAGELEIPGYSTYLHPINDNYVFSLGLETDNNGWQTGLKVSLFNISDMNNPVLVNSHVLGNNYSWSDALYNHREFSFLQTSDDQLRISFPVTFYDYDDVEAELDWYPSIHTGLQLFEINGLQTNEANLEYSGEVVGANNNDHPETFWYYVGRDRGIMHNDAIFYTYASNVIGQLWPSDN